MVINDTIKSRSWNELVSESFLPEKLYRRIDKLKEWAWNDNDFWDDLLFRHGLNDVSIKDLDPLMKDHALGNFKGMLFQIAYEHGIKI